MVIKCPSCQQHNDATSWPASETSKQVQCPECQQWFPFSQIIDAQLTVEDIVSQVSIKKKFGACYLWPDCQKTKKCIFLEDKGFFATLPTAQQYASMCMQYPTGLNLNWRTSNGAQEQDHVEPVR